MENMKIIYLILFEWKLGIMNSIIWIIFFEFVYIIVIICYLVVNVVKV